MVLEDQKGGLQIGELAARRDSRHICLLRCFFSDVAKHHGLFGPRLPVAGGGGVWALHRRLCTRHGKLTSEQGIRPRRSPKRTKCTSRKRAASSLPQIELSKVGRTEGQGPPDFKQGTRSFLICLWARFTWVSGSSLFSSCKGRSNACEAWIEPDMFSSFLVCRNILSPWNLDCQLLIDSVGGVSCGMEPSNFGETPPEVRPADLATQAVSSTSCGPICAAFLRSSRLVLLIIYSPNLRPFCSNTWKVLRLLVSRSIRIHTPFDSKCKGLRIQQGRELL